MDFKNWLNKMKGTKKPLTYEEVVEGIGTGKYPCRLVFHTALDSFDTVSDNLPLNGLLKDSTIKGVYVDEKSVGVWVTAADDPEQWLALSWRLNDNACELVVIDTDGKHTIYDEDDDDSDEDDRDSVDHSNAIRTVAKICSMAKR